MKIGFTGTQIGMSAEQKRMFSKICSAIMIDLIINELRHGDCIGADEDALIPIPVFYDVESGEILLEALPKELRKEYGGDDI